MAEKDFNIELLREDLGIPYAKNLHELTNELGINENLFRETCDRKSPSLTAVNFLEEHSPDVIFSFVPKNKELKEIIGDLCEVDRDTCFEYGLQGNAVNSRLASYSDLSTVGMNNKIDSEINKFYKAMCDNDTLAMSKSLQAITCIGTMYEYLEEKMIDNVYISVIKEAMIRRNQDLSYEMKQPKFRDENLEVKMKEEMAPKLKELAELKEKVINKDELKQQLRSYSREGLIRHMTCNKSYQKEAVTNLRNKIKEIETIRAKYIKEDTKHIEKARVSLINRYQIKRDSVEQSTEMKM